MTPLSLIPVVLSLLVLGAHFLRSGNLLAVSGTLVLVGLLFVRRPWAARAVQISLVLASLEWIRTLLQLTVERMHTGQPFLRMAIILGIVAAVTLLSAFLFQSRRLLEFYGLRRNPRPSRSDP